MVQNCLNKQFIKEKNETINDNIDGNELKIQAISEKKILGGWKSWEVLKNDSTASREKTK